MAGRRTQVTHPASGAFVGANGKKANYSLAMGYDNMHNITHKRQDVVQQSVKFDGILNAGYDLSYTYANNSQQIANIADASYRAERSSGNYATGSVASDSIDHKTHSYRYDANGNLLYVGTGKKINDSTLLESSTRRLLWDEDNRLLAISDNGYVSNYWYDASGERTVKQSGGSEGVFVNGVLSAARTQTSKFTAYVSPYLVVSNGGNYSKHIYVGSQRITSKLSNSLIFDESRNPLSIAKAKASETVDYSAKFNTLTGTIAERFDSLGVIYKGTVQSGGLTTQGATSGVTPQYFYHPDHLGSSSLITDENGLMVQHIQYVPFGEVFVEERTTSWSTPYKFNAKELDPETGLYYYHARYYDPRTSVWLSVDPLAEMKPNFNSYNYCSNNPINRIDPDGKNDFGQDVKTGQLSLINSTKDNFDRIILGQFDVENKQDGPLLPKEDGSSLNSTFTPTSDGNNSIIVSKGVFPEASKIQTSEKMSGRRLDFSKLGLNFDNAQEGISVMKFISFNIHKELLAWGYSNSQITSLFVVPWHKNKIDMAFNVPHLLNNSILSNISFLLHTHPDGFAGDFAMGRFGYGNPSPEDYKVTEKYKNQINYYILSKHEGYTRFFYNNSNVIKRTFISF